MSDARDPICGMAGAIERHGHRFCSERCIAEFERRAASPSKPAWWRDPWVWVPASAAVLAVVSPAYREYLQKVGVPFLIGLALGGLVDHFVPKSYIVKLLSGPGTGVIGRATVLGFLASTCSHGALALSIELYRKGASVPAVISFLLASPWASMALTFILLSLFGPPALWFIGGALAIAWLTGLIFQRLSARGLIDRNPNTTAVESLSIKEDIAERWRRYPWTADQLREDARGVLSGMVALGRMTMGWVQIGLGLSALLGAAMPQGAFTRFFGRSPLGLLATLGLAAVIEVCSEGTAPLAYELYRHTGALGNAFAFLMAGVVTDYTELALVWANIGRRSALWMLAVALPMVLLAGMLLNIR